MKSRVRFLPEGVEVEVGSGASVLEAANLAGVGIQSTCGGKGTCGKCRIAVKGNWVERDAGPAKKSPGRRRRAERLACQTVVTGDLEVTVPEGSRLRQGQILITHRPFEGELDPMVHSNIVHLPKPGSADNLADMERVSRELALDAGQLVMPIEILRSLPERLRELNWKANVVRIAADLGGGVVDIAGAGRTLIGAALDVGTTTVVLSLFDLASGKELATASDYNLQIRAGDDVISRIAYAEEGGLEELRGLVLKTISSLMDKACRTSPVETSPSEIDALSVAGNTTMIHLFLGIDPRHIRYEPYLPATNIPPVLTGNEVGLPINPHGPVLCVPGRAGFVGGDITADVIASGMRDRNELAMLIDVGTNGEVVLGDGEFLVSCSTSAGPAFEGGEVACGMRAMTGAIESVAIGDDMTAEITVIGNGKAAGVCGSGLIDLLAQMFVRGIVDRKGHFNESESAAVRARNGENEFVVAPSTKAKTRSAIVIREDDIANLIRTKAALYAGGSVLLRTLERRIDQVQRVYIAGGFGNYVDVENAILIGLLPDLPRDRFVFIGNGALAGASLALLSGKKRAEALRVHEEMTYIDLSGSQTFFDEFSSASFLPHTDLRLFPTVAERLGLDG
ncbi:MAG TPA: ASKHA domain-containing protein [Methanomassiliicoccales archaeon]|nr:ASKHA domain-containing protein [Methanomassiliicoccales archaeon]